MKAKTPSFRSTRLFRAPSEAMMSSIDEQLLVVAIRMRTCMQYLPSRVVVFVFLALTVLIIILSAKAGPIFIHSLSRPESLVRI